MSYEPPPPPSPTNRSLVVVIVILAGVLILGFAGCAGLGLVGFFWSARAQEEAVVAREEALQAEQAARQRAEEGAAEATRERAEAMKGMPPPSEYFRAQAVIVLFLQRVRDDRPDDAFELTSSVYKKERDREGFGKFLAEQPGLKRELHSYGMSPPEQPGEPVVRYSFVSDRKGTYVQVKFTLSKENDQWLIDMIQVREDKVR
jgi:hypothetical protein